MTFFQKSLTTIAFLLCLVLFVGGGVIASGRLSSITLTETVTFISIPRAPCEGESTRTPTPTATFTITPTPTVTYTSEAPVQSPHLIWPPNCSVLRDVTMPIFVYDGAPGSMQHIVIVFNESGQVMRDIRGLPSNDDWFLLKPDALPPGRYYWYVYGRRPTQVGGNGPRSEIWEFTIDPDCTATCTQIPTATPSTAP
jgi:hypothetical protein